LDKQENKLGIGKTIFTLEGMRIIGLQSHPSIINMQEELSAISLFKYARVSIFLYNSHHFAASLLTSSYLDVKSRKLITWNLTL